MDEIRASELVSILELLIRKYGNLAVTVNGLTSDITIDRTGDRSINFVEKGAGYDSAITVDIFGGRHL